MARPRSPPCESNGSAEWGADKGDSNSRPPHTLHMKVLTCPLSQIFAVRTVCGFVRTFTPAFCGCWAWPASAGAQRRRDSEENFPISCAKLVGQRRKRVRRKFCDFGGEVVDFEANRRRRVSRYRQPPRPVYRYRQPPRPVYRYRQPRSPRLPLPYTACAGPTPCV